ncbi:unnamed protein product [Musa acuminata subsp. malaccensis]|uniref:(wild Malaysian banana) hypothetical protein n=1 Tax=Musa acuminata subsp. malaccensis TaxID=214687 RepID=A0A804KBJ9_MUSAM|nr:unnamed protein product [Musa acuminata subsp. malaccensis]
MSSCSVKHAVLRSLLPPPPRSYGCPEDLATQWPPGLRRRETDDDNAADPNTSHLVKDSQMKRDSPEISPVERLSDRRTELAKVITYSCPIYPQGGSRSMPSRHADAVRYQACHPPIKNFKNLGDICLPEAIPKKLKEKGIVQPTPIHLQGLPAIHGLGKLW